MADSLTCMICVDFYGLPGCGKSMLSHLLAEKLRYEGYDITETSFEMDHCNSKLSRYSKKINATIKLLFSNLSVFFRMSYFLFQNGIFRLGTMSFHHILNLSYKICAYRRGKNIVFFDEGFAQTILSMSMDNAMIGIDSYAALMKLVGDYRKNIKIYVKTTPQTSLERIRKRNDGQSRLDGLQDEDVMQRLTKMEKLCEALPCTMVVDNDDVEISVLVDQVAFSIKTILCHDNLI